MPLIRINSDGTRTEFLEITSPMVKPSGSFSPATWKELHTYKPTGNKYVDGNFLDLFASRVRGEKCNCAEDWKSWVRSNPPKWNDYFAWTVTAHNAVNLRLNKPTITPDQAKALWSIDNQT